LIAQEQLQVGVEAAQRGPFSKMVNLLKQGVLLGIKAARIEYAFFLGGDFCQGFAQGLGGEEVLFVCEQGLDVGKRQHHVIRCQGHRLGELVGGCVVI
jgi:hypothetical protein